MADDPVASPDAADKALIDRTRQPALGSLDKTALRDLIRALRTRRDALIDGDKSVLRPVVGALRRAVDERKLRQYDGADGAAPARTDAEKQAARAARQQQNAAAREAARAERRAARGKDQHQIAARTAGNVAQG